MNLNKVFIIGRVTDNVELRATASNQSVANFSVATNRVWTNKEGQKQEDAEFHNVVAWGRQAEIASQFLTKGGLVMIEGRLQTRTWQGKDGQNRRTTEIVCERLQLGPRPGGAPAPNVPGQSAAPKKDTKEEKESQKEFEDSLEEGLEEISIDEGGDEIKPEDLPF
jgi:single-strand DNA-binding protein